MRGLKHSIIVYLLTMKPIEARTGIFYNSTARSGNIYKAKKMGEELPGSEVRQLEFPLTEKTLPSGFDIVVFWGGDGTAGSVVSALMKRKILQSEKVPFVVVGEGGTENGLHKTLNTARKVVTINDIKTLNLDKLALVKPGIINFRDTEDPDGRTFITLTGIGSIPLQYYNHREDIRRLPVIQKAPRISSVVAGARAAVSKDDFNGGMQLAFAIPCLGSFNVLPEQDIESNYLTFVSIKPGNRAVTFGRLVLLFALCTCRGKVPPTIASIEIGESFKLEGIKSTVAITDGEKIKLPQSDTIFLTRTKEALKIGALRI